jgi:hypothetical protein
MTLEVGKKYKTQDGRIVKITKYDPEWNGGMYWGSSIDKKRPKIDHERWTPDARWWSYISHFAPEGYQELRDPDWDFVEEAK